MGGGATVGAAIGVLCLLACLRLVARRGGLDLGRSWDRWVRVPVIVLWVVVWPGALGLAGAAVGSGYAIAAVIHGEQIGRRAAILAFKGVAAAVLAGTGGTEADQVRAAREWTSGERRLALAEAESIVAGAPQDLETRLATVTRDVVAGESDAVVVTLVGRFSAWAVGALARREATERMKLAMPVLADLRAEDAAGDGDGMVTVEEIAGSISRVHVEPRITRSVVEAMAVQALPLPFVPIACVLVPWGAIRAAAALWPPGPPGGGGASAPAVRVVDLAPVAQLPPASDPPPIPPPAAPRPEGP